MGGYGPMIAGNMAQRGQEDLARYRMLQDEQRRQKLNILQNAWGQTTDPNQREQIQGAITSLYPDATHGPAFLADLFHIHHKNVAQGQQHAAAPAMPPPNDALGIPLATGALSQSEQPVAVPQQVAQVAKAPSADDAWKAISQIPSTAETQINTSTRTAKNAQTLQELKNKGTLEAAKARGMNARPVHIGDTTPKDAILNMRNLGYEYLDDSGQPITPEQLSEAPEYTKLVEFRQGPNTFYKLVDQNTKMWNIGGVDYQAGTLGKQSPETLQPLGQATSTLPKFHQVPGMAPGEKVNLSSGTVATPGITAPPAPGIAPPGASPVLQTRPVSANILAAPGVNPGARVPGTKPTGAAIKVQPATSNPALGPAPPAFAPGTMLQQGRSAQPVVSAMSTVASNVFGGGSDAPIWDNAGMFDKPELRGALNRALTLNALSIPGTHEDPSFAQTLATSIGVTGWSQQQINDANIKAREELQRIGGPEALRMFARMAGMQEDLSALRTATRGSAAQGSIQTLVRAAPVYNVSSGQNFRDQLGVTLNTASSSMAGYPAINPAFIQWFQKGAEMAKGSKPKSAKTPGGPTHSFAIDDQGRRRKVLDASAPLPAGWKWGD